MEWRSRATDGAGSYAEIVLRGNIKSTLLRTILILSLVHSAEAALLCAYIGPDSADDYPGGF